MVIRTNFDFVVAAVLRGCFAVSVLQIVLAQLRDNRRRRRPCRTRMGDPRFYRRHVAVTFRRREHLSTAGVNPVFYRSITRDERTRGLQPRCQYDGSSGSPTECRPVPMMVDVPFPNLARVSYSLSTGAFSAMIHVPC